MTDLIQKLKSMKNVTKGELDKVIYDYSHKNVIKDLQELDIDPSALKDEELKQLLAEEINKNRKFSKGALTGAGFIILIDMLG